MIKVSLKRATEAVVLDRGDDTHEDLELREMLGDERDSYLDSLGDRVKLDSKGKPIGVKKFDGMQADLLSRCLYRGDVLVTAKEIQKWPCSISQTLFVAAQSMNHLSTNKDEGEEKND